MTTASTSARSNTRLWFLLALLAVCTVALGIGFVSGARNLEYERARADGMQTEKNELLEQNTGLRSRLLSLESEIEALAQGGNQSAAEALRRQRELDRLRSREAASAEQLQRSLAESRSHAEELAGKIGEFEREIASLKSEVERHRREESQAQARQESTQRLVTALQEQLKGKERTLSTLEKAYQRYKDSNQESSRQLEAISQTLGELEELNRRRVRLLEQAGRRVKELSENLRTMAVRIDSDLRGQSGFSTEITRMQSAALALEDQISQINGLNTQASRLERKLEQARNSN